MSSSSRSGRRAVTHWRVLGRFDRDRLSLVELTLETGRTHQIRVHLSEMNLPIVGDPVYGSPRSAAALEDPVVRGWIQALGRQALHARVLGFIHPATSTWNSRALRRRICRRYLNTCKRSTGTGRGRAQRIAGPTFHLSYSVFSV